MAIVDTPTTWLLNSFSLSTLREFAEADISVRALSSDEARAIAATARSAVGHADTAELFSRQLGVEVAMDRRTVVLALGDRALVGQHVGERLAIGTLTRPQDAEVRWLLVEVKAARGRPPPPTSGSE